MLLYGLFCFCSSMEIFLFFIFAVTNVGVEYKERLSIKVNTKTFLVIPAQIFLYEQKHVFVFVLARYIQYVTSFFFF